MLTYYIEMSTPEFTQSFLVDRSKHILHNYYISNQYQNILGNIYWCCITDINEQLRALFLTSSHIVGIINMRDFTSTYSSYSNNASLKAVKNKFFILQCSKESNDKGKHPAFTSKISIYGRYIVYMPVDTRHRVFLSKKSENVHLSTLKVYLKRYLGSWIIRTAANDIPINTLKNEAILLAGKWMSCLRQSKRLIKDPSGSSLLYLAPPIHFNCLFDFYKLPDIINVNNNALYASLKEFLLLYFPNSKMKLVYRNRVFIDTLPIFSQIHNLYKPILISKGGIRIIYNKTAALHIFDANSAKFKFTGQSKDAYLQYINTEVLQYIYHFIQLSNISGMILVDLIDMPDYKALIELEAIIHKCILADKATVKYEVLPHHGIIMFTRSRRYMDIFSVVEGNLNLWHTMLSIYGALIYNKTITNFVHAITFSCQSDLLSFLNDRMYLIELLNNNRVKVMFKITN